MRLLITFSAFLLSVTLYGQNDYVQFYENFDYQTYFTVSFWLLAEGVGQTGVYFLI